MKKQGSKSITTPFIWASGATPNIGLAMQGGGKFCIFHQGVEEHLMNSPIYPRITARTGVSGSAVHDRIVKANLVDGTPENIQNDLDRLYKFVARNKHGTPHIDRGMESASDALNLLQQETAQLNPMAGMNFWLRNMEGAMRAGVSMAGMTQDFKNSAGQLSPESFPLERLKRVVNRITPDSEALMSDTGFAQYINSVTIDIDGTLRNHSYRNPSVDEVIRSCALKEFGGYQGHLDGAYLFNPHLDRMIEEHDLTDLILISTNPYDPRIPHLPQSELQDHEHAHESGLKYSEALSEMHTIHERYGIIPHGIHLQWQPDWSVRDKIHGSQAQMQQIKAMGGAETSAQLSTIEKNIGKKPTYNPEHATLPSLLEPEAA